MKGFPQDKKCPGKQRLALGVDEAAMSLGISRDHFEHHVMPNLRIVRSGRRKLVPVPELYRWLDQQATLAA